MISVNVRKMCIIKAARLRRTLAATSSVDTSQVPEQLENAMEEYPLAMGIGFAALGALIGVLLPRTRREDELLGEQSDQLVTATKEKGDELLQRGKAVAQRVTESAVEEARQQGLTPEAVGERISEFAGKVGEVVFTKPKMKWVRRPRMKS